MEDYLVHYGVKGMKWGVRRTDAELGHETRSGRYTFGRKGSVAETDREDRETRALAGANARRDMNEASKRISQLKNDKKMHSETKKEYLAEERELYKALKANSERYLSGLSKDEIRSGKARLQQLLDSDTSANKVNSYITLWNTERRADLALKHPAGSKNRYKAEKYKSKGDRYADKGNEYASQKNYNKAAHYWAKAKKYGDKWSRLSSD